MRSVGRVLALLLLIIALPSSLSAAVLENPTPGSFQSGIGLIRVWACEANQIDIVFDGSMTLQAAYGTSREDTQETCGKIHTGFGLTINWNLFSNGLHTVRAFVDGQQFGSASFTVTDQGQEFLTGVTENAVLKNFPQRGKMTQLQWQESAQNFVLRRMPRWRTQTSISVWSLRRSRRIIVDFLNVIKNHELVTSS